MHGEWFPRHVLCLLAFAAGLVLSTPGIASAGMPTFTLSDMATLRLEAISFFLLGFLVSARVIQGLWNGVGRELANLPRLSFGRAVGLTTIWGLLFLLVLTMISGARELMTPGAWQKRGLTYKLADDAPGEKRPADPMYATRLEKLVKLRDALWQYARKHDGLLPGDIASSGLADDLWSVPDPSGMKYLYFGGTISEGDTRLVALEPGIFRDRQMALTAGGIIGRLGDDDLTYGPRRRHD